MLHVQSNPAADLHPAALLIKGKRTCDGLRMTVFEGAVDATFAAFGIDAAYTPRRG